MSLESVRVGFEPTKPVTAWLVSSELISASHPPHQSTNSWIEYIELLLYFKRKNVEEGISNQILFYCPTYNMAEEVVWIIESWETWWGLKEWVTEADVQRIQENVRQVKKVAQQLQQDKKQNNQIANFLAFLLDEISNDKIIKWLYDTFFITIDPKTNTPYFRKSMNDVVVVWLFYPFYPEKAEELWVAHYYENLNNVGKKSVDWYITYLQDLSDHYHDNIPINQNSFIKLLVEIFKEFLPNNSNSELWENVDREYEEVIREKLL